MRKMRKRWGAVLFAALLSGTTVMAAEVHDKLGPDMGSGARNTQVAATHWATGVVKGVDDKKGEVIIAHEAVKSLKWPGMTMPFRVKNRELLGKFAVGGKVEFELAKEGSSYVVVGVR